MSETLVMGFEYPFCFASQAARAAERADEMDDGWLEAALNEERPPPEDTLKWFCLRMMPMLEEAPTTPDQALSYQ